MWRCIFALLIPMIVFGCSRATRPTTQAQTESNILAAQGLCHSSWCNPRLSPSLIKTQFAIDNGYCISAAYGAVSVPQVRIYSDEHQGPYYFNGTATSYNPYTGYTNTQYNGQVYSPSSGSNPFVTGMANGMNIREAAEAERARKSIYAGCMTSLGWIINES